MLDGPACLVRESYQPPCLASLQPRFLGNTYISFFFTLNDEVGTPVKVSTCRTEHNTSCTFGKHQQRVPSDDMATIIGLGRCAMGEDTKSISGRPTSLDLVRLAKRDGQMKAYSNTSKAIHRIKPWFVQMNMYRSKSKSVWLSCLGMLKH